MTAAQRLFLVVLFVACGILAGAVLPRPAAAQTEFGVEDDMTVLGADGTVPDADLEVKGFSVFGSTDVLTYISTAPGNTVFNGAVQASSHVYVVGRSTFAGPVRFQSGLTAEGVNGLSAPVADDEPATKAYFDALVDNCEPGTASVSDIIAGKTADIDCDNFAEVGTLAAETLSASTDEVKTGIYAGTWLSVVDADLAPPNIRSGVTIFGKAGTFTSGASAVAGDILSGKTAGANGALLMGTLPIQTLSAANDTVNAGYYTATTLSAVDADLAAANIRSGYTIFGFAGTFTADATAVAGDILSSKTAGSGGAIITGTLPTRTLSNASQDVSAGYYNATTLSAVDADLAPANIKSGVTIFGKTGTMASWLIPDTGQTASYTSTFGEDHDYAPAAAQPSYTDNGDYTVTDNRTGLMWKKCLEGLNNDSTCSGTSSSFNWEGALARCEGLSTLGYSDWRLPNIRELMTLIDFGASTPAINTTYFPNALQYVWSSTTVPGGGGGLGANFSSGQLTGYDKTFLNRVRCVRGP